MFGRYLHFEKSFMNSKNSLNPPEKIDTFLSIKIFLSETGRSRIDSMLISEQNVSMDCFQSSIANYYYKMIFNKEILNNDKYM
jgi:hypothetical protein